MIISASEANLSESSTEGIFSSDEAMPAIMSSNS